ALRAVELAVEHHALRAILVEDRLVAADDVDDAQPAMAKPHSARDVEPPRVGSTVAHDVSHAPKQRPVNGLRRIGVGEAGDAAHGLRATCPHGGSATQLARAAGTSGSAISVVGGARGGGVGGGVSPASRYSQMV